MKLRSVVNPTMSDLLSNCMSKGGGEFVPLSKRKNTFIQVDEVIKRHDARVAKELLEWMTRKGLCED